MTTDVKEIQKQTVKLQVMMILGVKKHTVLITAVHLYVPHVVQTGIGVVIFQELNLRHSLKHIVISGQDNSASG